MVCSYLTFLSIYKINCAAFDIINCLNVRDLKLYDICLPYVGVLLFIFVKSSKIIFIKRVAHITAKIFA